MNLRKLEEKDACLMLEWMHDTSVTSGLKANFAEKNIDDCIAFIKNANDTTRDLHLAIVNDNDEYMGTVSLKHINHEEKSAEFAITVRKVAMGKGFSSYGMKKIIEIGLNELGLNTIYWCVSEQNPRAVRFYDKNGYLRSEAPLEVKGYDKNEIETLTWYAVKKN